MAVSAEHDIQCLDDQFYNLVRRLEYWRNADHWDTIILSRHEVIALLEGIRQLGDLGE